MRAKAVLVFGFVLMLAGCTSVLDMAKSVVPARMKSTPPPSAHLDLQRSVFIALPGDGESASDRYCGSGQSVAHAVAEAFAKRGIPVEVARRQLTNDEAMASAARTNAGYLVLPTITHWEQRNVWLGLPSRLAIRVSVVEMASGRVVLSKQVESHSTVPISVTVESPEALLEKPLAQYVSMLY